MAFEKESSDGKRTKYSLRTILNDVFESEGVAGVIAILIIGTICVISLVQVFRGVELSIPKYFSELTALIVGYYFGSKRARARQKD